MRTSPAWHQEQGGGMATGGKWDALKGFTEESSAGDVVLAKVRLEVVFRTKSRCLWSKGGCFKWPVVAEECGDTAEQHIYFVDLFLVLGNPVTVQSWVPTPLGKLLKQNPRLRDVRRATCLMVVDGLPTYEEKRWALCCYRCFYRPKGSCWGQVHVPG